MEDTIVSETLTVQSHSGPYQVHFDEDAFQHLGENGPAKAHFILDTKVADLYRRELQAVLNSPSVLRVQALESNKSLEETPAYVEHLVAHGVRRGHVLIAIGGGIIQDIVCFLAAVLLRGLDWYFYPTTLLAQADSCIGSKSSINVGNLKNIVGTFTPPKEVFISTRVLGTLDEREIRSGIGEMLKVHVIDGPDSFDRIAADYSNILQDRTTMSQYILRSLKIKKAIIERDEFDRGIRNIMNYGHSFGHAIESATDFAVPHGIAISIGMDMANYTAVRLERMEGKHFERMHKTFAQNYRAFETTAIPLEKLLSAITKDKKNTDAKLSLILPDAGCRPRRVECVNDEHFRRICGDYFAAAFR